ncbi:hypothetical protein AK812_SmicGene26686 [Symbiodinium microadriaticum]|uniref:Uncharacterized protein n=1 Tax=Symbiodinium microadriaticum TaxID=2951 RepID=A0A1Q9D8X8_SYMMI|nr:hypothetical protein AK812_SmicGene26686 [Symbiodinium microadriaticum]CAE7175988.1 unnamed protein product [Symbiodinium microadriaticum]
MSRRRPPDLGAAASVKLIEGAGLDDAAFREAYKWDSSYILFEVFGDDNEVLGLAVGKVDNVWPFDVNGGFVEISYLGTDSEYYRWFIENRGKKGGLPEDYLHHLCRKGLTSCMRSQGRRCIHVQRWAEISRQKASEILREWGYRGLARDGEEPGVKPVDRNASVGTAPKRRAKRKPPPQDLEGDSDHGDVHTVDDDDDDDPPPRRGRKPRSKPEVRGSSRENVLDRMMEVPEEVPDRDGAGVGPLDAKLSDLRDKLRSKVGRKGGGPGMLLAEKAQSAMSAKKKKRRSNQEDVVKKLRRALSSGRTKARGSTDPGDDWSDSESEDDDDLYEGRGHQSDISARRKKLKKIAEDHPGKLLEQGLSLMKEQVGATYGGGAEEEERLTPVVMRYYLSVVLPNYPVKVQGEARVREMRTLASALDLLCRGKIDSAADMLMQRFKSLCMSLRDNSDRFGKFLELLPDDVVGTATTLDEVEFARTLAVKQAKADEILARASGKSVAHHLLFDSSQAGQHNKGGGIATSMEESHFRPPAEAGVKPVIAGDSFVAGRDGGQLLSPVQVFGKLSSVFGLDAERGVTFYCLAIYRNSALRHMGKQQRAKLVSASAMQVWRLLSVIVLNGEHGHWQVIAPAASHAETAAQAKCLQHLTQCCAWWTRAPLQVRPEVDFYTLSRSKQVDYSGDEVLKALPLRLGELMPGLPEDGVAGSLDASAIADDTVQRWLLDPTVTLLEPASWPDPLPAASMKVDREHWFEIVGLLFKKRILVPIDFEEIFKVRGKPVLNGVFAVEKKGTPLPGELRVTRLIMNLVPANSLQKLMAGDLGTLAGSAHWASIQLRKGEALLWSGDDQRGAFYAWSLPAAWRGLMTFKWPVPGRIVGRPDVDMIYVASGVIPMGWLNAVSLFQHLHRRAGLMSQPSGAGLVPSQEWRRDRPVPAGAVEGGGCWFQFYLDDFDCPEKVDMASWKTLANTMSQTHAQQRGSKKLVLSLFDGVAALMVALARLECCVIGYAASEMDKRSKRLIRTRWPGVMELGPVQHITDRVVQHLVACIGYRIDFVLVGAALSNGRSGSLSDVVRIINLLKDAFAVPVHFMVEHDINMSGEQLVEFSRLLEVKPYLVDAKHFTWIRKPSLFWVSWFITARDGEKLVDHESYSLLLRDLGGLRTGGKGAYEQLEIEIKLSRDITFYRAKAVDLHQWMRHLLAEHRLNLETKLLELQEGQRYITELLTVNLNGDSSARTGKLHKVVSWETSGDKDSDVAPPATAMVEDTELTEDRNKHACNSVLDNSDGSLHEPSMALKVKPKPKRASSLQGNDFALREVWAKHYSRNKERDFDLDAFLDNVVDATGPRQRKRASKTAAEGDEQAAQ